MDESEWTTFIELPGGQRIINPHTFDLRDFKKTIDHMSTLPCFPHKPFPRPPSVANVNHMYINLIQPIGRDTYFCPNLKTYICLTHSTIQIMPVQMKTILMMNTRPLTLATVTFSTILWRMRRVKKPSMTLTTMHLFKKTSMTLAHMNLSKNPLITMKMSRSPLAVMMKMITREEHLHDCNDGQESHEYDNGWMDGQENYDYSNNKHKQTAYDTN